MTLSRKYTYHGRALSYFNANCPAPKGVKTAVFPLARANFFFAEQKLERDLEPPLRGEVMTMIQTERSARR